MENKEETDPDIERFCRMMDKRCFVEQKVDQICSNRHQPGEHVFGAGYIDFIDAEKEHRRRIKESIKGGLLDNY